MPNEKGEPKLAMLIHCKVCGYKSKGVNYEAVRDCAQAHKHGQHNVRISWSNKKLKRIKAQHALKLKLMDKEAN